MKAVLPLRRLVAVPLIILAAQVLAPTAGASHSWNGYHWARTTNPFTLRLGDNVTAAWDQYLRTTASDWTQSAVLDTSVVSGNARNRRCAPTTGRVEVCNASYGSTGWLGVASIWASGSHITQGTVKVNDTYFSSATYNTPAWRNLVMCQEVGHTLGLDHQDEAFDNPNLGTCMDYTSNPSTNQHPNGHDYDQLEAIYGHLDGTTTVAASTPSTRGAAAEGHRQDESGRQDEWGRARRHSPNGRPILFERDLGGGDKQFTWVVWAEQPTAS